MGGSVLYCIVLSWCLPKWTGKTCNSTFKIAVCRLRLKQECNSVCVCVCDSWHQNYTVFSISAADWHNWVLQRCSLSKVQNSVTFELNEAFYFSVGGGTCVRVTCKRWHKSHSVRCCNNIGNFVLWQRLYWDLVFVGETYVTQASAAK